jgi:ribosomal protein S18 acetylase RimI-like enzyme
MAVAKDSLTDHLAGWADVKLDENKFLVLGMGVDHRYRGMGVGRLLLQHWESFGRSLPANGMYLEVFAHNTAAIRLYESRKFRRLGDSWQVERKDGRQFEAFAMRLNFGPEDG